MTPEQSARLKPENRRLNRAVAHYLHTCRLLSSASVLEGEALICAIVETYDADRRAGKNRHWRKLRVRR